MKKIIYWLGVYPANSNLQWQDPHQCCIPLHVRSSTQLQRGRTPNALFFNRRLFYVSVSFYIRKWLGSESAYTNGMLKIWERGESLDIIKRINSWFQHPHFLFKPCHHFMFQGSVQCFKVVAVILTFFFEINWLNVKWYIIILPSVLSSFIFSKKKREREIGGCKCTIHNIWMYKQFTCMLYKGRMLGTPIFLS